MRKTERKKREEERRGSPVGTKARRTASEGAVRRGGRAGRGWALTKERRSRQRGEEKKRERG